MAPLVAPDVVRYTIAGKFHGQECLNILDVAIVNITTGDRQSQAFEVAGDLLNQWADHILPVLSTAYTADEVRWVDLDDEDGTAGARTSTSAHTWPDGGAAGGAPTANNLVAVVTKVTEGRQRNQRNGRLMLGGLLESYTEASDGNRLTADFRTDLGLRFEDLKDGINGTVSGRTANLVVVHTAAGTFTSRSDISTFAPQEQVGTMRRRMPGYGN